MGEKVMMTDTLGRAQLISPRTIHEQEGSTSFDVVNSFLDTAPVDLENMARALGLKINMSAEFPNGESGRISKNPQNPGEYLIDVNRHHSENRKRFTLAHEISHYLLHRDKIGNGITDNAMYRSSLGDFAETEANKLAAKLILPSHLVRIYWTAGIKSLPQLCAAFVVSEGALRIRLKELGLGA
jgi:hypothetical protein